MPNDDAETLRFDPDAQAAIPWLHVYAQPYQHRPCEIWGTRTALTVLRDALSRVLETSRPQAAEITAADGEGYRVEIQLQGYDVLLKRGLPYSETT